MIPNLYYDKIKSRKYLFDQVYPTNPDLTEKYSILSPIITSGRYFGILVLKLVI